METDNAKDVRKRWTTHPVFSLAIEACLCGVFILSIVAVTVRFVNPPLAGVWWGEERASGGTFQCLWIFDRDGTFELLNATERLLVSRGRYDVAEKTSGIKHIRLRVEDYEITSAIPTTCALIDRTLIVHPERIVRLDSGSPTIVHHNEGTVYRRDMDSISYFFLMSLCCSFLGLAAWRVRKKSWKFS
jgi:hypothetical protein